MVTSLRQDGRQLDVAPLSPNTIGLSKLTADSLSMDARLAETATSTSRAGRRSWGNRRPSRPDPQCRGCFSCIICRLLFWTLSLISSRQPIFAFVEGWGIFGGGIYEPRATLNLNPEGENQRQLHGAFAPQQLLLGLEQRLFIHKSEKTKEQQDESQTGPG